MKFTINTSVETKDKGLDFWKNKSYHTDDKNTSDAARAAFEVFCLTTVYPIYTTGVHGNSGGKSAGKDVFPSGKGRKCLGCQRIDIMPILALSCYFLCIQFHIVLQIYYFNIGMTILPFFTSS